VTIVLTVLGIAWAIFAVVFIVGFVLAMLLGGWNKGEEGSEDE
jgi:hypothetical protein